MTVLKEFSESLSTANLPIGSIILWETDVIPRPFRTCPRLGHLQWRPYVYVRSQWKHSQNTGQDVYKRQALRTVP